MSQGNSIVVDLSHLSDVTNSVYYPLYNESKRHLVLYGGSGSGKSVFAAQKILYRILTEQNHKILCVRKVARTVKNSMFALFEDLINQWNLREYALIYKSELKIEFPDFNSEIIFTGLDDREKLKSIHGVTSQWVEEATELEEDDVDQLDLRLRGVTPNYKQTIYSFNPISEDNFLKRKFFDSIRNDVKICHSTYLHNRFIDPQYKEVLESQQYTNPTYYQVYTLGLWGIQDKSNKFLYSFSRSHIAEQEIQYHPYLPVWISFDFNVDPMSMLIGQRLSVESLNIIEEIKLNDSNIFHAVHEVKQRFDIHRIKVTGDASGNNRTVALRGNLSIWKMIAQELSLKDAQIYIRSRNLPLKESRLICNTALEVMDIKINPGCKTLINNCLFAKTDWEGSLIKDSDKHGNHMLDCLRYLLDVNFSEVIYNPKKLNGIKGKLKEANAI